MGQFNILGSQESRDTSASEERARLAESKRQLDSIDIRRPVVPVDGDPFGLTQRSGADIFTTPKGSYYQRDITGHLTRFTRNSLGVPVAGSTGVLSLEQQLALNGEKLPSHVREYDKGEAPGTQHSVEDQGPGAA